MVLLMFEWYVLVYLNVLVLLCFCVCLMLKFLR